MLMGLTGKVYKGIYLEYIFQLRLIYTGAAPPPPARCDYVTIQYCTDQLTTHYCILLSVNRIKKDDGCIIM